MFVSYLCTFLLCPVCTNICMCGMRESCGRDIISLSLWWPQSSDPFLPHSTYMLYVHTLQHVDIRKYIHMYVCTYIHLYLYFNVCSYLCVNVRSYLCVNVRSYLCVTVCITEARDGHTMCAYRTNVHIMVAHTLVPLMLSFTGIQANYVIIMYCTLVCTYVPTYVYTYVHMNILMSLEKYLCSYMYIMYLCTCGCK